MRQRRHCARERAVLQALVAASAASTAGVRAQGTHDGRPCAEALQSMSTELNGACCSPVSNCVGGFAHCKAESERSTAHSAPRLSAFVAPETRHYPHSPRR